MAEPALTDPTTLLWRALESDRVHSAYLLAGPGDAPRQAAERFARGLACSGSGERPCEECDSCRRSGPRERVELDGTGRRGPLYRHIGDHPDLLWVERDAAGTRVRIGQGLSRVPETACRSGARGIWRS